MAHNSLGNFQGAEASAALTTSVSLVSTLQADAGQECLLQLDTICQHI